ncbi:MAG: GHKL domain-containing protein [Blautia sp.]|nr:GHKL domain-containing protein [Blautia sp.]MDY5031741.1 GHKL domain-containing protein [Blautia sp.]
MGKKRSQIFFYLSVLLNQCTCIIYAWTQKHTLRNMNHSLINLLFMNLAFSLAVILFFIYAREIAKSAAREAELQNMQEIQKLQDAQTRLIRKKHRETAIYQQEMLLKLKKIHDELEHGSLQDSYHTLQETAEEFDTTRFHPVCADSLLNAILSSKYETAVESGIDVKYQILCPGDLALSAQYISCVFFNLLDNGIEACRHSKTASPKLELTVRYSGNSLFIHMINSKSAQEHFSGNTTKKDCEHHGFGLSIIEEIVSACDGSCEWLDHGETFESTLLFTNCPVSERSVI